MGSIILRWVMMFEKFITNIAANNFSIWGIAIGGIFAVVALILGYALLVQAAAYAVVILMAVISKMFNFPKGIRKSAHNLSSDEEDNTEVKGSFDKSVDKSRRIKIGSIYWTV